MIGYGRVRTVEYHELVLPLGSDVEELEKAIRTIRLATREARERGLDSSPITFHADDTNLILRYERVRSTEVPVPRPAAKEFLADE